MSVELEEQVAPSLLAKLAKPRHAALLTGILRGAEREALRVDSDGKLALSAHPPSLGSALTHPQITTDFSEALLEFITPPSHPREEIFGQLDLIQRFVAQEMHDELLWTASMPCVLGTDNTIPVAHYGSANNARMKTIYRLGLGERYGRAMQTIAGVHYNFSLPDAFWAWMRTRENSLEDLQDYKDRKYFDLIRNFRRYFWLLIYLFGASPASCKSFVANRNHDLLSMPHKPTTLYKPYATSLRMGDLGYQSTAQESLYVCYNRKDTYISTLCHAITTPYPDYENIGVKNPDGAYKQLNTGILQIENEFYSSIRPKRTSKTGETALLALCNRGVEYIEVRCLDIDPFNPLGFHREQIRFLDNFLLWCCMLPSPQCDQAEADIMLKNQKSVVNEGRDPNLQLLDFNGQPKALRSWANELLKDMQNLAEVLDMAFSASNGDGPGFQESLEAQIAKVNNASLTPSARLLHALESENLSYPEYALKLSKTHTEALRADTLPKKIHERFKKISELSLQKQKQLEAQEQMDFDLYLEKYYAQYGRCCAS